MLMVNKNASAERVSVWQCIGCGKIDSPQPCIGICEDRKVEMVYASAHDQVLAEKDRIQRRAKVLQAFVRRVAHTTPREGKWKLSYRAMQQEALRILATLNEDPV